MKVATYSRGKQLAVREEPGGEIIGVYGLIDMTTYSIKQPETAQKESQQEMDAVTPAEQPGETEAKEQPAEGSGELGSMKLNDLRELARNSGVKIPKNATKDKIIELLLSNE